MNDPVIHVSAYAEHDPVVIHVSSYTVHDTVVIHVSFTC